MNPALHLDHETLTTFCRKWRIRELSLFGSALRDDFKASRDLDFLVSFDEAAHWDLWDFVSIRDELATLTGRDVDLVDKECLRNPYRIKEILSTREELHAI